MSNRSSSETSVLVRLWRRLLTMLSQTEGSWVWTRLQRVSAAFERGIRSSALARFGSTLGRWTRSSYLYRWLTAEPDPDVIVIDLRETYTVGPLLAVLDRIVTAFANAWQTSGGASLAASTQDRLRARPVQIVSLVVLVAVLTEFALTAALGTVGTTDLAVRLPFVVLAAVGTRIQATWEQCTDSVVYRTLVAILEPPDPPSEDEDSGE